MVRANKNYAPVSGPGRLARRTDLGPASGPTQAPTEPAPGQPYGDRQGAMQEQSAAPMQGGGMVPAGVVEGAFGPTQRPSQSPVEPNPAAMRPQTEGLQDPDMLLRALYLISGGHPDLERLLLRRRPRY